MIYGGIKMSEVKRLYKTKEHSMISGVCAGLSEYLQIDVSIIRLVWLGSCFFAFAGVIVYIAAAIILPEKRDVVKEDPHYHKPYEDVEFYDENGNKKM